MRRHIISAALLLVFGLLAGCGQKGPLYLPTKAAAPASASSAPATATSAAKPAGAATTAVPASSSSSAG
jgi:predicted small lipoprotein YifL